MAGHGHSAPSPAPSDGGHHGGITTNNNGAVKQGTDRRQVMHGLRHMSQTIGLTIVGALALLWGVYYATNSGNESILPMLTAPNPTTPVQQAVLQKKPACGISQRYELSAKKPYMKLEAKTGEVLLGCGMNWQRTVGPKLFFSIDGGKWYSWGYDETYGATVPPVGKSIAFKMAAQETGKVTIVVNYPKP